jgi:hypothetical protein
MRISGLTTGLFVAGLGLAQSASAQMGAGPPPSYPQAPLPGVQPAAPYQGVRPLVLRYEPGAPAPPGYRLEETPRKGLIVAGALTFGIPYLISLTIGGASRHEADRWLMLPVVGPVGTLTYGTRGCDRDDGVECVGNILIVVGLAFDLLAQTAGAVLFTMGYVFPKKQWVNDLDIGSGTTGPFTWSIAPRVDAAGRVGLVLTGTTF